MKRKTFQEWCNENNRMNLLSEWDVEKNAELGYFPNKIGCKSSTHKVWWRCKLGHSFDMYVYNRTSRNDGCPFCSNHRLLKGFNDLEHVVPELSKEWDYVQNTKRHVEDVKKGIVPPSPSTPSEILYGSSQKVYWVCSNGHHSFLSPNERKANSDGTFAKCNKCAIIDRTITKRKTRAKKNNLAELVPQAVKEWVYSEHNLMPSDVSCFSRELVHWRCKKGHEFDKYVCDRVKHVGNKYILYQCLECSKHQRTSITEQICFYYVRKAFPDAINTYKIDGVEFDIYVPSYKYAIEYDGSYFHRNRLDQENKKDDFAQSHEIRLFRFRPKILPDTKSAQIITIEESVNGVVAGLQDFFTTVSIPAPSIDINRDYNDIMSIFEKRIGESVAQSSFIREWDFELNSINPNYLTTTECKIQVYWRCLKGHPSYLSCPYNRTVRHTGCPICSIEKTISHSQKRVRNIETGEIFKSISDAERKYGKDGNTSISCCCRGKYKTAYGYHWEYVEE